MPFAIVTNQNIRCIRIKNKDSLNPELVLTLHSWDWLRQNKKGVFKDLKCQSNAPNVGMQQTHVLWFTSLNYTLG